MKRTKMKRMLALLLGILLCAAVFGCGEKQPPVNPNGTTNAAGEPSAAPSTDSTPITDEGKQPEVGIKPSWSNTAMNGICVGLTGARSRKLDLDQIFDLMDVMNVQAMRNWMHLTSSLADANTPLETQVNRQKGWIAKMNAIGIQKIVGMSHYWFWPESVDLTGMDKNLARSAAPYRDLENSLYIEWLELYEQTWYTMASTYPEIGFWEVGNEVNMDLYLHPLSYEKRGTTFTQVEKAEIVTDMLYYASRGIHRANPEAIVIFPGLAPIKGFEGMASFLEQVYKNIQSGEFGGGATDTNCYFQAMAWHGYVLNGTFDVDEWINGNHLMYRVMQTYGDGDKKVFLTEFGFSDGGSQAADAEQAAYYEAIYARLSEMPYLDSIYPFRMLEDTNNADKTEVYYGMFRVFDETYLGAKEKAKTICRLYGGDVSALDRYIGNNLVYPS